MPKQRTTPIIFALALALNSILSFAAEYPKYSLGVEQGRYWDPIDTNKDNLISPD
jgi:hypothetical protein